jgi:hypothetical protein
MPITLFGIEGEFSITDFETEGNFWISNTFLRNSSVLRNLSTLVAH